jgi:hypothetical protein
MSFSQLFFHFPLSYYSNSIHVRLNYLVIVNINKLANGCKKYHKLTWDNVCFMFSREKFQVRNQVQIVLRLQTKWDDSKHYETSSWILRFLNTIRHGLFKTSLYYFSKPSHIISWALDKSHDFQTPFVFNTIKKHFKHTWIFIHREQIVWIFEYFHG